MAKKIAVLMIFLATAAQAKEPVFAPTKNQTMEEMEQDKTYCIGWATEQTKKSDTANTQVKTEGAAVRGGARGAAAGAAIGAAAGDAGKGAAVGAAVVGIAARRRAKAAQAQQQAATGDYYYRSLSRLHAGQRIYRSVKIALEKIYWPRRFFFSGAPCFMRRTRLKRGQEYRGLIHGDGGAR